MLQTDYELSYANVQALSGRDALAAFFAELGYNTNERLVQNAVAMNITNETLKTAITHIERLASHDGRMFEVYLFELKSVTVAATQGIVRTFRNRPGDYLLVLIDSDERYERLDFVLRRFSYTEPDTFAQYEKLLSAYDMADWSEQYFNNRALFSDYYLMERLPESNEWKQAEKMPTTGQAFRKLRDLYADVRNEFADKPEAVVRTHLLEPALTALGFTFQSVKPSQSGIVSPDYRLLHHRQTR